MSKQELYFFDFDKLFENFADKYYHEHQAEYESPEDFSNDLDRVYHLWATSPQDVIGGLSPSQFINAIPTDELIDILVGACSGENNPSSLLFDRVATEPTLLPELIKLALGKTDEKLLHVVMSLINELGGADVDFYIQMMRRDIDLAVKEHCVEALCDNCEKAKEVLIENAMATDDAELAELYAEPLTYCATGDDRILNILLSLLATDPNRAYIAGLIARYGDDRAVSALYPLLDDCNYAEFIEFRNAIEALGGTVDEHYRDFSDDPLYSMIKHPSKRNNNG